MNKALRNMRAVEWQGKEQLAPVFTAACGIAISSGILASLIYLLLTLSSMVMVRPAFAESAPVGAGVRLQSGIEKESVDRDRMAAMEIYEEIAAYRSTLSRALQALAQTMLGAICGYWRTSGLPPGNDLPLVIVQMAISP